MNKNNKKYINISNKIRKIKQKKVNLEKEKITFFGKIISYIIYDLIMIISIILYIKQCNCLLNYIENINKIIKISVIYGGILIISISGALVSSKIDKIIIKKNKTKKIKKIENSINIMEKQKQVIINKQKLQQIGIKENINNKDNVYEVMSNVSNFNNNSVEIHGNIENEKELIKPNSKEIVKKRIKKK